MVLQLHIFTLQLFEEMELQQNLAFEEHLVADCKRWFWLLKKIIFRLLACAWQLAYWRSNDANTQTFLLWTPTWIPSLISLLVLHQQNLGDHFSSRNLHAWMIGVAHGPSHDGRVVAVACNHTEMCIRDRLRSFPARHCNSALKWFGMPSILAAISG